MNTRLRIKSKELSHLHFSLINRTNQAIKLRSQIIGHLPPKHLSVLKRTLTFLNIPEAATEIQTKIEDLEGKGN